MNGLIHIKQILTAVQQRRVFFHTQITASPEQKENQNRKSYNNIRAGKGAYQHGSLSLSQLKGLDTFAGCKTSRTFPSAVVLHKKGLAGEPGLGSFCTQMSFISGINGGLVTVLKSIWKLDPKQNGVFLYNKDFCYESSP